nr:Chain C, gag peptide [synthetic construct]
SLANTVATL